MSIKTENINWITATGTVIPVNQLHTNHIKNIINCLNGYGSNISDAYLKVYTSYDRYEWLKILSYELSTRDV